MRYLTVLASLFLTITVSAQEAPKGLDPISDFKQGNGVPVDTLDIGDGRLQLVLKDDHTWYYIKNHSRIDADFIFQDHWDNKSLNPYAVPQESLPIRNSICLVDSMSTFTCPYQGKVFSKFGYRGGRRHQGTDIPLPSGTPIHSSFDGKVRVSMYTPGYGNLVIIRHESGLETYYGHLSKRMVKADQWVHAGDVIGLGGSSGRATGSHLHFETRYQGFAFDPQWLIDFESGKLRSNVFVLHRNYLSPSSQYVPQFESEEDAIYAADEEVAAHEEKLAAEKAATKWHSVKSGDTLSAIARKYGKALSAIVTLNPGINKSKLRIGQKIRVN